MSNSPHAVDFLARFAKLTYRITSYLVLILVGMVLSGANQVSFAQTPPDPWTVSTEQGVCTSMTSGEINVRRTLYFAGVFVNKCPCPPNTSYKDVPLGCTTTEGLNPRVINGVILLQSELRMVFASGALVVSGGTELGHSDLGACRHDNRCKVDLINLGNSIDQLNSLIQGYFDPLPISADISCHNVLGSNYGIPIDSGGPCFTNEQGTHFDVGFPSDSNSLLNLAVSGSGAISSSLPSVSCISLAACATNLTRGINLSFSATADPMWLLESWAGVDTSNGNLAKIKILLGLQSVQANFIQNLPPPDDSGCWNWNPSLGGSGGWEWSCPGKPNPCWGAATLSVSCRRKPPNGCWHWDPLAGAQGAWIYDPGCGGNPTRRKPNPPVTGTGTINVAGDPNDKRGAQGAGAAHYLSGNELLRYAILFENLPTASAPAAAVVIKDSLNTSNVELRTLKLGPISFGSHVFTPPPVELASLGTYTTNIDLRPTENLGVRMTATLDVSTGSLTWTLTSLDPSTGLPPADSLAGFLAIGEEGSVSFSVAPKAGTATNTQLTNKATIVFDANAPMDTPVWSNTIDTVAPTSGVLPLPSVEPPTGFTVAWSGTDVGSGIQDFTIFVSDNGAPFTPFLTNTSAISATFTGQLGHTYGFYSIARDLVGNVEASKTTAEATTLVSLVTDNTPPVTSAALSAQPNAAGWNKSNVTVTLNSTDSEPGGTGVKQIQWSLAGAQTGSNTVPGNTTTVTISTEGTTTLTYFGTDNAGNQEAPKTLTIQIDKTPPSIAGARSPAPNANGWNNTNVTVSFTCSDGLSGLVPGNPPAPTVLSAEGAGQSVVGTCMDVAGNSAAATVSGINIDKTPPVITASANPATLWPPNGKMVAVTVSGTMSDNLSGINPSTAAFAVQDSYGLVQPNGPVSLAPNGTYSFTISLEARRNGQDKNGRLYMVVVNAQDNAGNAASSTTTVTVPHDQGN
jgi:hypothetical protein